MLDDQTLNRLKAHRNPNTEAFVGKLFSEEELDISARDLGYERERNLRILDLSEQEKEALLAGRDKREGSRFHKEK